MRTSWKRREEGDTTNFWPAFADMAAATCMMLVVIWIAGTWELNKVRAENRGSELRIDELNAENEKLLAIIKSLNATIEDVTRKLADYAKMSGGVPALAERNRELELELSRLKSENAMLAAKIDNLEKGNDVVRNLEEEKRRLEKLVGDLNAELAKISSLHKEPPNIMLMGGEKKGKEDESERVFQFDPLKPTISAEFRKSFKEKKLPAVVEAINSKANVEVIEIIGHTDSERVSGSSNVDENLIPVFSSRKPIETLVFGSNCELGLARAIAVKGLLQECLSELRSSGDGLTKEGLERLSKLEFRTYSAAQLFPLDPSRAGSGLANDEDRRIEIRFTRLRDQAKP